MRLNTNYINRLKPIGYHYYFLVSKGIFLLFDVNTLEYEGIHTIFNISEKTLVEKETEGLNKLYKLGWII